MSGGEFEAFKKPPSFFKPYPKSSSTSENKKRKYLVVDLKKNILETTHDKSLMSSAKEIHDFILENPNLSYDQLLLVSEFAKNNTPSENRKLLKGQFEKTFVLNKLPAFFQNTLIHIIILSRNFFYAVKNFGTVNGNFSKELLETLISNAIESEYDAFKKEAEAPLLKKIKEFPEILSQIELYKSLQKELLKIKNNSKRVEELKSLCLQEQGLKKLLSNEKKMLETLEEKLTKTPLNIKLIEKTKMLKVTLNDFQRRLSSIEEAKQELSLLEEALKVIETYKLNIDEIKRDVEKRFGEELDSLKVQGEDFQSLKKVKKELREKYKALFEIHEQSLFDPDFERKETLRKSAFEKGLKEKFEQNPELEEAFHTYQKIQKEASFLQEELNSINYKLRLIQKIEKRKLKIAQTQNKDNALNKWKKQRKDFETELLPEALEDKDSLIYKEAELKSTIKKKREKLAAFKAALIKELEPLYSAFIEIKETDKESLKKIKKHLADEQKDFYSLFNH